MTLWAVLPDCARSPSSPAAVLLKIHGNTGFTAIRGWQISLLFAEANSLRRVRWAKNWWMRLWRRPACPKGRPRLRIPREKLLWPVATPASLMYLLIMRHGTQYENLIFPTRLQSAL